MQRYQKDKRETPNPLQPLSMEGKPPLLPFGLVSPGLW